MRMRIKSLTIFFFLLLFISCREQVSVHDALHHAAIDIPSINLNSISESDQLQMTVFADSVTHIKLETTDESLVGRISKILFFDNLLIIQDRQTHSVFVFDRNGKFINRIGRRGQGPGEYVSILRVMLNPDNRQIMVFDGASNKLIYYDLYGNFIREVTNFSESAVVRDIINLPNGNFLLYNFDQNLDHQFSGLWETDSDGVYVRTHLPPNTGYPFRLNLNNSYLDHLSDGVVLAAGDVDVIYHFRQDTLTAFLSYTIRNRTTAEDIRRRNRRRNINSWEVFDFVGMTDTHETENYIFTQWADEVFIMSVFSKRDNKIIAVGLPTFRCSRLATISGLFVPSNDVNSLVMVVDAFWVSLYLEHPLMSSELAKNKLLELIYGMSEREIENMNPIIQILHIRQ